MLRPVAACCVAACLMCPAVVGAQSVAEPTAAPGSSPAIPSPTITGTVPLSTPPLLEPSQRKPAGTGFWAPFQTIPEDFVRFFSADTMKVVGVGSVGAFAAHQWDGQGIEESPDRAIGLHLDDGPHRTARETVRIESGSIAEPAALTPTRELAYYYPDPMWRSGDWIKNLVLFFDGVAILLPRYLREKPGRVDPAITAGLEEHGLLEIVEPEVAIDRAATEELGRALDTVLASGALDKLKDDDDSAFAALSMSRLGFYGDESIAKQIFGALKDRKLARETEDGVSLPMHRQPIHQLPRMASVAVRGLAEDCADSTNAHRLLIQDRRNVVLRSGGKHGGTIHERKSSPMAAPPGRLHLGSVTSCVRLPAQAFRRDSVLRLKNALENDPFRWNHSRHLAIIVAPAR